MKATDRPNCGRCEHPVHIVRITAASESVFAVAPVPHILAALQRDEISPVRLAREGTGVAMTYAGCGRAGRRRPRPRTSAGEKSRGATGRRAFPTARERRRPQACNRRRSSCNRRSGRRPAAGRRRIRRSTANSPMSSSCATSPASLSRSSTAPRPASKAGGFSAGASSRNDIRCRGRNKC